MDEIKRRTQALLEAISQSRAYADYQKAREELALSPELRRTVNEFRKRSYELQNCGDGSRVYEEVERLERDFYIVRKNSCASRYLQSELELCRMLQTINLELAGAVDFDIEDFEDAITW